MVARFQELVGNGCERGLIGFFSGVARVAPADEGLFVAKAELLG